MTSHQPYYKAHLLLPSCYCTLPLTFTVWSVPKTSLWPEVDQNDSIVCCEFQSPEKVRGNLVQSFLLREIFHSENPVW